MYCLKCTTKIIENARFCLKCGTSIKPLENNDGIRERHAFTTFWLIIGIIFPTFIIAVIMVDAFTYGAFNLANNIPFISSAFLVVGYILLFYWKISGFITCLISTVIIVTSVILEAYDFYDSIVIFANLAIFQLIMTFLVLQIRKNGKSTWSQLK